MKRAVWDWTSPYWFLEIIGFFVGVCLWLQWNIFAVWCWTARTDEQSDEEKHRESGGSGKEKKNGEEQRAIKAKRQQIKISPPLVLGNLETLEVLLVLVLRLWFSSWASHYPCQLEWNYWSCFPVCLFRRLYLSRLRYEYSWAYGQGMVPLFSSCIQFNK